MIRMLCLPIMSSHPASFASGDATGKGADATGKGVRVGLLHVVLGEVGAWL